MTLILLVGLFAHLVSSPQSNDSSMHRSDTLKTYLALGDSYTIGESVRPDETYPAQTVSLLNARGIPVAVPEIIATTGWTTADLQEAVRQHHFAHPSYDIVTLLIGVNNQFQGKSEIMYKEQFTDLLLTAIRYAGNNPSRVTVLSIPDYSVTPFAQNSDTERIARQINSFNLI